PPEANGVYGGHFPGLELARAADQSSSRLRPAHPDGERLIKIPGAGRLGKFVSEQVPARVGGTAQLVGDGASRTLGGERRD
ncbi:MAG: hypothetical protein ACRDQZ_02575, partial [Mycobacteriales bacterium]